MLNIFNYIYDINLLLIVIWGIILCAYKPSKLKTITFLIIAGLQILFIYSCRYGIGIDYFNYFILLNQHKNLSLIDIITFKGPVEPGFGLILKTILLFSNDPITMYLIIGLIITTILMIYIYHYSSQPWISVYLYVSLGFMFGTMNLVRQYFAAVISLFSIKFAKEKKFIPFLIVVLISASIHKTALIMIPVYFICRLNITWKSLTTYASLTLLSYILCDPLINFITQYIYKDYNLQTGSLAWVMGPMPIVFIWIPFIYCITAILTKNKLLERDKGNIILINYSIYTFLLYIMMTKHLLLERSSNYFYISSIILGSELISSIDIKSTIQNKIYNIKETINNLKSKSGSNKQLENKTYELKKLNQQYKDINGYYLTAICSIIFIGFISQLFALGHGNHYIFPYKSIFTEERNIEKENTIKQMSES